MLYNKIIANTIAQEILDSGIKIPSLPASAPQLLSMIHKPLDSIDIGDLEKLIQKDPVLFAQLINLANSPYYRTTAEVTGLRTAIMRIGLADTIHSLYLYLFKNTLPTFPKMTGFSDKAFWEESWACAIANRRLGDPRLMVESLPGELYIAGLLHGIGRLILAVYDPENFNRCLEMSRKSGRPLEEVELKVFNTTDAHVARHILAAWNIPDKVCAAVEYWKTPEASETEFREISALTQFASAIVRISGVVTTCEGVEYTSTSPCLEDLSNTYLLRDKSYPIVNMNKQFHIVQEIVAILEKHFISDDDNSAEDGGATEKSPTREKRQQRSKTRSGDMKRKNAPKNDPPKSFFAWVKSLFQ